MKKGTFYGVLSIASVCLVGKQTHKMS